MSDPIRVLVVDDDLAHAEMVVQFLRLTDAWADAAVDTAPSYDHALTALTTKTYDVAFVDYWLGSRDGLALLREVRQRGVTTPVIVLTSRGAEEVAVEAMKAGAADYLSKTHLSVEALERTIRYALALRAEELQRQQAEAALRSSEERFRALVEQSADALLLVDVEGRVTYMTLSSQRHLGWRPDDLVGHSIFQFIHADDREAVTARRFEALQTPRGPVTAAVRFRDPDGGHPNQEGRGRHRLRE